MKIPITHAIDSGAWLQCERGEYNFRIKLNVFERAKLSEIDEPEKIAAQFDLTQGDFWLLKFDIISLTKQTISHSDIKRSILVLDHDNFEYIEADETHLIVLSNYADTSGLRDFIHDLYPKIKYPGAILFFLPREDNTEYFLSVSGGNIKEA